MARVLGIALLEMPFSAGTLFRLVTLRIIMLVTTSFRIRLNDRLLEVHRTKSLIVGLSI